MHDGLEAGAALVYTYGHGMGFTQGGCEMTDVHGKHVNDRRGRDNPERGYGAEAMSAVRSTRARMLTNPVRVPLKRFFNLVNYHHFLDRTVFLLARDPRTKDEVLIPVHPGPCRGDLLSCTIEPGLREGAWETVEPVSLVVDTGDILAVADVEAQDTAPGGITVRMVRDARLYTNRKTKRHACSNVYAVIAFSGERVEGELREYHPGGLRVSLRGCSAETVERIRRERFVTLNLISAKEKVYAGTVRCTRAEPEKGVVVFEPLNAPVRLCRERTHRNVRVNPDPAPRLAFVHPLTGRRVFFDIVDLTTAGFSIVEKNDKALLMTGMTIRCAEIVFPGELALPCSFQVVYAKSLWGRKTRFGCAITDMTPHTYTRLFNLVTRAIDPHSVVTSRVSLDSLWEFFFQSGFIYPEKYQCISGYKEAFKATYEQLYHDCPDIFASITYQSNDSIYGHVSIIRAYPRTWMVHHLAALPKGAKRTGIFVLQQILNFLDGFHRMPSTNMGHLMFYYRPENKFPNFFFGGVHKEIGDQKVCSIDQFAYILVNIEDRAKTLPQGWEIAPCAGGHLDGMVSAYRRNSSGIMIDAFDLGHEGHDLWDTYRRLGLTRQCSAFMLVHEGREKAYFLLDRSDRGLNLSDLLNSIKVFIPDPASGEPTWEILQDAVSILGEAYGSPEVIVQIFPAKYLTQQGVPFKTYNLWVLKARYLDPHLDDIKANTNFSYVKFIKSVIKTKLGMA